jgi:hypothetical protein
LGAVIFIEQEGFAPILDAAETAQIAGRFDVAIMHERDVGHSRAATVPGASASTVSHNGWGPKNIRLFNGRCQPCQRRHGPTGNGGLAHVSRAGSLGRHGTHDLPAGH